MLKNTMGINAHDHFVKTFMQDKQVARDLFVKHLPNFMQKRTDLSTLSLSPETFVSKDTRTKISDIIYTVNFDGEEAYLSLLVEHQSTPQRLLPFRLLEYTVLAISRYLRTHKNAEHLPLIWPMVLYHGQPSPYPHTLDLIKCFKKQEQEIASAVFRGPIHLVDLGQIPDEKLREATWSNVMQFTTKHILRRDLLNNMVALGERIASAFNSDPHPEYIKTIVDYVILAGEVDDPNQLIEDLSKQLPEKENAVETAAQYLERKGIEKGTLQGMEKGMEKGINLEKYAIARKMIRANMEIASILEITGLSETDIIALQVEEESKI